MPVRSMTRRWQIIEKDMRTLHASYPTSSMPHPGRSSRKAPDCIYDVQVIKKGRAVLDKIWCRNYPARVKDWQVLEEGSDVYGAAAACFARGLCNMCGAADIMLNQTNVKANNNKFYVCQLLCNDKKTQFDGPNESYDVITSHISPPPAH